MIVRWWRAADRAGGGLWLDLGLYAAGAVFAGLTAVTSTLLPHRAWGAIAVFGYAAAALAAAAQLVLTGRRSAAVTTEPGSRASTADAPSAAAGSPSASAAVSPGGAGARSRHASAAESPVASAAGSPAPPVALAAGPRRAGIAALPVRAVVAALAWAATSLLPLVVEAAQRAAGRTDRAQEEVLVVEHGGQRLLDTGTPYLGEHAIAALPPDQWLLQYLPYQPGMALFGLPRALAGTAWYTDARVWFALATAAALALACGALLRERARAVPSGPAGAGTVLRGLQVATVLPVCALTLATGGDDLPVLALCLLALALCARDRFTAAGIAVGLAGALKLFAWPVTAVLLILVVARSGRPALGRFAAGALGLPVLAVLPPLAVDATALGDNVLRFPLGHGLVDSPAQSPFPGHLIATYLPGGSAIASLALLATGALIAWWLARRPPRTAAAAAGVCAIGLLAAILLMPSTRFGYLLYPAALAAWAPALRRDAGEPPNSVTAAGTVE